MRDLLNLRRKETVEGVSRIETDKRVHSISFAYVLAKSYGKNQASGLEVRQTDLA